jgi:predicted nucleotidyltransferase
MSNTLPLMDLLFPGTRQRALAVLLLQPDTEFHLRELSRLADTHAGTLMRELDKLAQSGLLSRTARGNQVCYRAERACPLFSELAALFRKTHGAVALLREALAPLVGDIRVALIYGSAARGQLTPGSDIDLLVLGTPRFDSLVRALYPLQQVLGREINPALYAPEQFAARVHEGDAFARGLLDQPMLFVEGNAGDLAELVQDWKAAHPRP